MALRKKGVRSKFSSERGRFSQKKRGVRTLEEIMEDGKYFASIIGDSMTTCDEIIDAVAKSYNEETKTVTTNFNQKKSNL